MLDMQRAQFHANEVLKALLHARNTLGDCFRKCEWHVLNTDLVLQCTWATSFLLDVRVPLCELAIALEMSTPPILPKVEVAVHAPMGFLHSEYVPDIEDATSAPAYASFLELHNRICYELLPRANAIEDACVYYPSTVRAGVYILIHDYVETYLRMLHITSLLQRCWLGTERIDRMYKQFVKEHSDDIS